MIVTEKGLLGSAALSFQPYIGFPWPRNRANLFQWTPHENAPSKSVPPTLPFRQGAAPVCVDRMADPIPGPDDPDSSPHPRYPSDSRSLPPPDRTTRRSSQPHHATPRTEAKPIKDPPRARGLVHCAVYSIPRPSAFSPTSVFRGRGTEQTFFSEPEIPPTVPVSQLRVINPKQVQNRRQSGRWHRLQ
jgi:hypothetical protein